MADRIPTPADRRELRDLIARSIAAAYVVSRDDDWHGLSESYREMMRRIADAILSTLDKAGVVCLPVEPTRHMIECGINAAPLLNLDRPAIEQFVAQYRLSAAASPYAPEKTDA